MWRANENDRSFLGHLPTTPGMDFAEEQLHQYRERPEESIVDRLVHDSKLVLLFLRLLVVRHFVYNVTAVLMLWRRVVGIVGIVAEMVAIEGSQNDRNEIYEECRNSRRIRRQLSKVEAAAC